MRQPKSSVPRGLHSYEGEEYIIGSEREKERGGISRAHLGTPTFCFSTAQRLSPIKDTERKSGRAGSEMSCAYITMFIS